MNPIPKDKVKEILDLHSKDIRLTEISKATGVNYHTLRGIIRKKLGGVKRVSKEEIEDLHRRIAEDRMTMCIGEVAKKYDRSVRYISAATKDHPEKHLFKRKSIVKKHREQKPAIRKQVTAKDEPKLFRSDGMGKGHIKLKKNERVLPTKAYDPNQQRSVPLNDGRNTLIFVNINDTRSDDEV